MQNYRYPYHDGIAVGRRLSSKTHSNDAANVIAEETRPHFPQTPQEDLVFRGGRAIADLAFKIFYVGTQDWNSAAGKANRENIDRSVSAAMSDSKLNNDVMQYFGNNPISSTSLPSAVLPFAADKDGGKVPNSATHAQRFSSRAAGWPAVGPQGRHVRPAAGHRPQQ